MTLLRARLATRLLSAALLFAAVPCTGASTASAQTAPANAFAAAFEKREYQIPMRDGVKLFTAVYVPRNRAQPLPILLNRTPYSVGPYGTDNYPRRMGPAPEFASAGYIFAYQDVRGRYRSEGRFEHMTPHRAKKSSPADVDESTDTYDTIDWLIKNIPQHNGRVGLWGISYGGFYAAAGMIDAHPALKAVSPQAPQTDWFLGDDTHHNGAFFLASTFNFMSSCGRIGTGPSMTCGGRTDLKTKDGYQLFLDMGSLANADEKYFQGQSPGWTDMMKHGTYDKFWKDRAILPHVRNVKPAVLTVGGWFDANNFYGALHLFETIEKQSAGTDNAIVIGPWSHGQWAIDSGAQLGIKRFGANTSYEYRQQVLLPFFEYHLKGIGAANKAKAHVFETGTNKWRDFPVWPPKEAAAKSYYFAAGGRISDAPAAASRDTTDKYVSDPKAPVPFMPVPTTDMNPDYMAQDQRFATTRPDAVVYRGDALRADMTIAGPVSPTLFVTSTGTDGDWVVKVMDEHPDGTLELVRGDVVRAKFRKSMEKPEPLKPGVVTELTFEMPDVLHTFRAGHRMVVQVQSSWFPLVDRNPQTFVDIYRAKESDFRAATQQIVRSARHASRVTFHILPPQKPALQ